MLGPAVGRFTSEVLNPIIIRTIGILFRKGKLGEPPDELRMNPNYEIDYIGALAQSQKRSQLNSLVTALTMAGQMAQFSPDILDKVNGDKAVNEVWDTVGAPVSVLRDDEEVEQIRSARAQEQAKAQELQMLGAGTQIAETASKVDKNVADAKSRVTNA